MMIHLEDYKSCIRPKKEKASWELLHEEEGFLDRDELLYDRELNDLDGQETHLSHQMEGHPVQMQRRRKRMRAGAR